jgi:hypothetical protein
MKKAEIVSATFVTLFVATMLIAVGYNIVVHGISRY